MTRPRVRVLTVVAALCCAGCGGGNLAAALAPIGDLVELFSGVEASCVSARDAQNRDVSAGQLLFGSTAAGVAHLHHSTPGSAFTIGLVDGQTTVTGTVASGYWYPSQTDDRLIAYEVVPSEGPRRTIEFQATTVDHRTTWTWVADTVAFVGQGTIPAGTVIVWQWPENQPR